METVGELFGSAPRITPVPPEHWPQPEKIWVNYDVETDSLILYLTGKPVRGVHVWVEDDVYLVVDPTTKQTVGMYVEAWERNFIPSHPDVAQMWQEIKPSLVPEIGWNQVLRAVALWIVMLFWQAQSPDQNLALRPA